MFSKALHLVLIILIASQSVLAFADVHQLNLGVVEHGTAETHAHHQGEIEAERGESEAEQGEQHSQSDCNHCCHCHGQTGPFLSKFQSSLKLLSNVDPCLDYVFSNTSFLGTPDNPPPIS